MAGKRSDRTLTDEQWQLVVQHTNLLRKVALQFVPRASMYGIELQDIEAEGRWGLMSSAKLYDPGKGVDFIPYASTFIKGYIQNYFRDRVRLIRVPREELEQIAKNGDSEVPMLSIDYMVPNDDGMGALDRIYGTEEDFSSAYVNEFIAGLTEKEKAVMALRMSSLSQKQIAERLGVSQMTICRTLERIGKKYLQQ